MATPRKRNEPQTNLPPKEVKGKEAEGVKGGKTMTFTDMAARLGQLLQDNLKKIASNLRA